MPHRPLFVSQCHHFSPVIYFIAISVSLPPPLVSSSLFLHLRSPRSLSFSLSHPLTRPHRVHEHLLARNPPPNHTTQFRSPHPLLEALLYASISVSFFLFLFLSRELELSFRLFRSRCLVPAAFELCRMRERERRKEREIERGRKKDRERIKERERETEERKRRAR